MLNANVIVTVVRVMLTDTCPITCPSICSLANVVSARTIDVKNIKTVSYIITVPINIIISLFCESFVSENSFVSDLKTSSMANKSSSIKTASYLLLILGKVQYMCNSLQVWKIFCRNCGRLQVSAGRQAESYYVQPKATLWVLSIVLILPMPYLLHEVKNNLIYNFFFSKVIFTPLSGLETIW